MHGVISLLIVLVPLAAFVLAVCQGQRWARTWTAGDCSRVALFWAGVLGLVLYVACTLFWILDNPRARITDCIDWGPWTGVPTLLVILVYLYTTVLLIGLAAFNAYRTIRKKLTTGHPSPGIQR